MIRYLPLVLSLVLTIYALIDCFQVDEREVRSAFLFPENDLRGFLLAIAGREG